MSETISAALQRHCDTTRPPICRPWSADGRTLASQGHYLLSVPGVHAEPNAEAPVLLVGLTYPPDREPDCTTYLEHLIDRDMTRPCARCGGGGWLACSVCEGVGVHCCPRCDDEHECGRCHGTGDAGPCGCQAGRTENLDALCTIAGVPVCLAYVVRLAADLRGTLDVWRVSEHDGWPPIAVMLRSADDTQALIMKRLDGTPNTPNVSEL